MWHVYMLETGNRALYTGITNDLARRLAAHRNGTGARFTKAFGVKRMVYQVECATRSEALKREAAIKKLPRAQKLELVHHP